jgi:hypothetical protein
MQSPIEIDESYKIPDPWGFRSNPDDAIRKREIINACISQRSIYAKALELGAGEGWITKDLPAVEKHGLEISLNARNRMPSFVFPRIAIEPDEKFNLIVAAGCLYSHYDYRLFFKIMRENISELCGYVVTCNIASWERPELAKDNFLGLTPIYSKIFPYREFVQKLRVFRK